MKYIKMFEQISEEKLYHGSRTLLPFKNFDTRLDGTGVVSTGGKKYGGFFFTTEMDNAEFYTEDWVAEVTISNIEESDIKHPPTAMKKAAEECINLRINDVLDGASYSDVVVVPHCNASDITVNRWIFVGDEDFYFKNLDNFFSSGEDDEVNKYIIEDTVSMISDLDYLLTIPLFRKYYDSKN